MGEQTGGVACKLGITTGEQGAASGVQQRLTGQTEDVCLN